MRLLIKVLLNKMPKLKFLNFLKFSLIFTYVLASSAFSQNHNEPSNLGFLKDKVKSFKLGNGLNVIFIKRDVSPVFTGQVWVKVGGADELKGATGAAHMLEHMAFKGTTTIGTKNNEEEAILLSKLNNHIDGGGNHLDFKALEIKTKLKDLWIENEFSKLYNKRGAVGLNAGTSKDYTFYTVSMPSNFFEIWCWLESERLLSPVFRSFYEERDVVMEERRTRVDDSPGGFLYENMISNSFKEGHPYHFPTIGWKDDLLGLMPKDIEYLYDSYYRPDNMVLVLTGDLELEEVKSKISKYFERIPKLTSTLLKKKVTRADISKKEISLAYNSEPQIALAYPKTTYPDKDDARFSIVHTLLSGGKSSILYKELVIKRKLALWVYTSEAPGERYDNLFYVFASPSKGVSSNVLKEAIEKILYSLKEEEISDKELFKAKRINEMQTLNFLKSDYGITRSLAKNQLLWGDWKVLFTNYETMMRTTSKDINNLARKFFDQDKLIYTKINRN